MNFQAIDKEQLQVASEYLEPKDVLHMAQVCRDWRRNMNEIAKAKLTAVRNPDFSPAANYFQATSWPREAAESHRAPAPITSLPGLRSHRVHPQKSFYITTPSGSRLVTVKGCSLRVFDPSGHPGATAGRRGVIQGACSSEDGELFLERWRRQGSRGTKRCLERWRVGAEGVERAFSVQRDDDLGAFLQTAPLVYLKHDDQRFLFGAVGSTLQRLSTSDGTVMQFSEPLSDHAITTLHSFVHEGRPLLAVGGSETSLAILDAEGLELVHECRWKDASLPLPRTAGGGVQSMQYVDGKLYLSVGWNDLEINRTQILGQQAVLSWRIGDENPLQVVSRNGSQPVHELTQVMVAGRATLLWRAGLHAMQAFVPKTGRLYRFDIGEEMELSHGSISACPTDDGGRVVVHDRTSACQVYRLSDLRYEDVVQVTLAGFKESIPDDEPVSGSSSSSSSEASELSREASEPADEQSVDVRSVSDQRKAVQSRLATIAVVALAAFALLAVGGFIGGRQLIR